MSSYDSAGNLLVNVAANGGGRSTNTVYAQTQTGISTNGDTGDIVVGQYSELAIDVNLTALVGTSIQFRVQRKDAFGNYTQIASNAALTGTGPSSFSVGSGMSTNLSIGDIVKVVWICTSVSGANFTISVKAK